MGAPVGNQNAARAKVWTEAVKRALERRSASRVDQKAEIDALADALIDKGLEGDMSALKEIGDRLEGKVAQPIGGSADLPPLVLEKVERVIVDPANKYAQSIPAAPAAS